MQERNIFKKFFRERYDDIDEKLRPALAHVAQWTECQPACEPGGHWFDTQSGHMPGLRARSPAGGVQEATTLTFLSLSFSFLPLSLKMNKLKSLKKRERERERERNSDQKSVEKGIK